MLGKVHSIESFGTLDGPGIRYVLFLKGCPMRCLYCHNPDTWDTAGGTLMSADEVLAEYDKNKEFYTKGGITVSGGEPLLQIDFLIDLFKKAHSRGIHTCIDTSGITFSEKTEEKLDELLKYTSLVMLDIKHIDPASHKTLTGHSNEKILEFARYLDKSHTPIWIRHVVVKGYTDSREYLFALGEFVGTLKNVKALDVLPYHTMGKNKYTELGLEYPLGNMPALSHSEALDAKRIILEGIAAVRNKK
ncbi:MAG: pyruvate formate lyase-activating protein [Clostridia bacterium]|nr:pyruvate formate lyase-activating protein [Clostridia bacterium]